MSEYEYGAQRVVRSTGYVDTIRLGESRERAEKWVADAQPPESPKSAPFYAGPWLVRRTLGPWEKS